MVQLPGTKKQTYRLNSGHQMWPSGLTLAMTLTLNFRGQTWNLLYLSQKWSDCQETKSKYIDWTKCLKCDHWVWPWPWPWIFKVKYGICYISAKNGPIATKRKVNISIGLKCDHRVWPWPWPFEFSRSNMEFAISQPKVVRRSGVRIYQIVIGVTSDVGVPSTHLVISLMIIKILANSTKMQYHPRWCHATAILQVLWIKMRSLLS